MNFLPALTLGFALGLRHATDADHIAAVGTLAPGAGSSQRAALVGAAWGVGHSVSVLLVGGALVMLRLPMPVKVALALEFIVAMMLIGLGTRSLLRPAAVAVASTTRPLLVGIVHGLAGSAVLALLVVSATDSAASATAYLIFFCIGTIVGMALFTTLLTLPARLKAVKAELVERTIRILAGVASVVVGLLLAAEIGRAW